MSTIVHDVHYYVSGETLPLTKTGISTSAPQELVVINISGFFPTAGRPSAVTVGSLTLSQTAIYESNAGGGNYFHQSIWCANTNAVSSSYQLSSATATITAGSGSGTWSVDTYEYAALSSPFIDQTVSGTGTLTSLTLTPSVSNTLVISSCLNYGEGTLTAAAGYTQDGTATYDDESFTYCTVRATSLASSGTATSLGVTGNSSTQNRLLSVNLIPGIAGGKVKEYFIKLATCEEDEDSWSSIYSRISRSGASKFTSTGTGAITQANVVALNFTGAGVTTQPTATGALTVNIPGMGALLEATGNVNAPAYLLTNVYATVQPSGCSPVGVTLIPGRYLVMATLDISGCTASDIVGAQLYNVSNSTIITTSIQYGQVSGTGNLELELSCYVYVSTPSLIVVQAQNAAVGRGQINMARTKIDAVQIASSSLSLSQVGISSFTPSIGNSTVVTITGFGFVTGGTVSSVLFAGSPATNIVVVNDTTIICTSPASTGVGAITVTMTNGMFANSSSSYNNGVPVASGGITTYTTSQEIHTFLTSGTLTPTLAISGVSALIVAGGGGGGIGGGGGGGAGGFLNETGISLTATGYTVTVGTGGAGGTTQSATAPNGGNSSFASYTAIGGGGGGAGGDGVYGNSVSGASGGSGGGGGGYDSGSGSGRAGGSPTAGQGYAGGNGAGNASSFYGAGGGGGSSAVGSAGTSSAGGAGGAGTSSSISGIATTYAAGGAGSGASGGTPPAAAANTGNGGDGGSNGYAGSAGGSGIVVVSLPFSGAVKPPQGISNTNLALQLLMTEGSGGYVYDSSSYNRVFTLPSGYSWTTNAQGNPAISIVSSSSTAAITGSDANMPVGTYKTIVAKFKVSSPSTESCPIGWGNGSGAGTGCGLFNISSTCGCSNGSSNYNPGGTLSGSAWNVEVVTISGNSVSVYLNGVLEGTGTLTQNVVLGGTTWLGALTPYSLYNPGYIYDYVAVWGRVLNSSEIAQLT